MPTKRRKRRSKHNPMRLLPNETVAQMVTWLARALGAAGVVAAPTVVSQRANDVKIAAANEATNTALATGAALQESLSVFRHQFGEFQQEMRESRRRERDVRSRLAENAVGPVLPTTWKPAKHWWDRIRGG